MTKTINWGIVGLGKIARHFANDLKLTPHAKLHAVASRSIEKAKIFAEDFDATHFYGSYEELLACPDLDVVYIATPHPMHCENALLFLKEGIPVLCEKPFAMNLEEVERMISAARESNTFLMEAIWTRFLPMTKKLLELVDSGVIGELVSVKADFGFQAPVDLESRLYNKKLGGGSLLDIGIYPLFLAQLLFNRNQTTTDNFPEVKAFAQIGKTGIDENCSMLLRFSPNQHAVLDATVVNDTPVEAHIYGTKGSIKIHQRWHESKKLRLTVKGKAPQEFHFQYAARGYRFEAEEVGNCLRAGKRESELLPLSFSRGLIKLLDAVRQEIGLEYS